MDIKILEEVYWGYSKLAVVVDTALRKLEKNHQFQIIGNSSLFPDYNISNPPALIIDGEVLVEGCIPTQEEMIKILEDKI